MSNQSDLAKSAAGFNGDPLSIDTANNRVGIGTTSPSKKLDVDTTMRVINAAGSAAAELDITSGGTWRLRSNPTSGTNAYGLDFIKGSAGTDVKLSIDSSGRTLLRTTSTFDNAYTLQVQVIGSTGGIIIEPEANNYTAVRFNNASGAQVGDIVGGSSSTSYNTSSDYRLKENVTDVTDGITRVKQLEPKRFNFIVDPDTTVDGFLAHEAQTVVPEAITGTHNEVDDDGNPVYQGIDQAKLVPLLTAALKESIAKIEALEARVTALEGS
jgi:predicted small secreted protein